VSDSGSETATTASTSQDSCGSSSPPTTWHRISFIPIRDPVSSKPAMMVTEYDISKLKQLYQDLKSAQEENMALIAAETSAKLTRRFVTNISHELRTPLNTIIAFNSLLRDAGLDTLHREYASSAVLAAEVLLGLINQILDFAKFDQASPGDVMQLDIGPFFIENLLEEVQDIVASRIASQKVDFSIRCPRGGPCVLGDHFRLRQCLTNLCDNAAKFSNPSGAEVSLACTIDRCHDDSNQVDVVLEVTDNGKGIPPEKISLLFKPFSQVDAKLSRKHGGTGLGLAITQKIIQTMRGDISCESEEDVRTTFRIRLRLELAEGEEKLPPPQHEVDTLQGRVVVYLKKNRHTEMVLRLLNDFGVEVVNRCFDSDDQVDEHVVAHEVLQTGLGSVNIMQFEIWESIKKFQPAICYQKVLMVGDRAVLTTAIDASSECLIPQPVKASILFNQLKLVSSKDYVPVSRVDSHGQNAVPMSLSKSFNDFQEMIVATENKGEKSEEKRALCSGSGTSLAADTVDQPDLSDVIRMLVADDHVANQKVATAMFTKAIGRGKCKIDVADDGEMVVEKATQGHAYDFILMDIQMPCMDGLEATRRIRMWEDSRPEKEPKYFIAAATAHATTEDMEDCKEAGMNEYLTKPLSLKSLKEVLQRYHSWKAEQQS